MSFIKCFAVALQFSVPLNYFIFADIFRSDFYVTMSAISHVDIIMFVLQCTAS